MLIQCPACQRSISSESGNFPPWCPSCGVELKDRPRDWATAETPRPRCYRCENTAHEVCALCGQPFCSRHGSYFVTRKRRLLGRGPTLLDARQRCADCTPAEIDVKAPQWLYLALLFGLGFVVAYLVWAYQR
jgi:hypothetical protein